MATFAVPDGAPKNTITVGVFKGVDLTNSPTAVSDMQSPNAVNMIRDVPGKVRKRMGYEVVKDYGAKINGCHTYRGETSGFLIHAGTDLYSGDTVIYSGMNNARSRSWQLAEKLCIADGKALLVYDIAEGTIGKASDNAYVPLVTIAKSPNGGGTSYEEFNLLGSGFREKFLSDGTSTAYQLSVNDLADTTVKAWVTNSQGDRIEKVENTDFTVDRPNGIVNFSTAPNVSPVTGEDNVEIQAYKKTDDYADRINKCDTGILYGIGGNMDRLFVSGNPDYINYDWYSNQYDPTYFPDTGYSTIGTSKSAIMGYSIINSFLATHKDERETEQCIILRNGELVESKPVFKVTNALQGAGAVSKHSFQYLETEPLYLTRSGIHAVTTPDSGEKYSQNRSYYINEVLNTGLENAYSCVYNDMYLLCMNDTDGTVYILDGLQGITEPNEPYATRQYASFVCKNIHANVMWNYDNRLYFGDESGNVFRFFDNPSDPDNYNDNGAPIYAVWETKDIDGGSFFKYKTFKYLAVQLASALRTSVRISYLKKGVWTLLKEDSLTATYLMFSKLVFSRFSFSSDNTPRTVSTKMRIKKIDKVRFKFENDTVNEPFGVFNYALEYTVNSDIK